MSANNVLSFPLSKVSLATDTTHTTKFSWNHAYQDVSIVFDNYGSTINDSQNHSHSVLKVMQGAKTLEHVNLADKVRDTERIVYHARQMSLQLKADQIPTTVIYRRTEANSIIALRYPLSDNMVRRIQLRFLFIHDFETALPIFQNLGCYIQDFDNKPELVPSTAVASTPLRQPTNANVGRPHTSDSYLTAPLQYARRPFAVSSPRPNTTLYSIQEHEATPYCDYPHRYAAVSDKNSYHMGSTEFRPTVSRAAEPQSELGISRATLDIDTSLRSESRFFKPTSNSSTRPSTAPIKTFAQVEDELSSMIPPRRLLPFDRPGSRSNMGSRGNSASRPTSAADLPALLKPSFSRPNSVDPANLPNLVPRNVPAAQGNMVNGTAKATGRRSGSENPSSPPTKRARLNTSDASTVRNSSILASRSSPTKPGLNDVGVQLANNSVPTNSDIISSENISLPARSSSVLVTALSRIDPVMSTSAPLSRDTTEGPNEPLKAYAALTHDQRMCKLEDMIISAIDDDSFVTLCEDVHGCWQRIGFRL